MQLYGCSSLLFLVLVWYNRQVEKNLAVKAVVPYYFLVWYNTQAQEAMCEML